MDLSSWPDMDLEPLSLEDSWRLRVVSAKVYSMVRNRDVQHFEKVLNFLEETYRLLPRLVTPIKHMKIVFGLKTMVWWRVVVNLLCMHSQSPLHVFDNKCLFVYYLSSILSPFIRASSQLIMWMLKRGRGVIDTMFKINQFFPRRLTQYQNQCVS